MLMMVISGGRNYGLLSFTLCSYVFLVVCNAYVLLIKLEKKTNTIKNDNR